MRTPGHEGRAGTPRSQDLAVHGLERDIRHGGQVNSYYDNPHDAVERFDVVLANPSFNVDAVDKETLKDSVGPGRRYPYSAGGRLRA
jgi:type I restriction enzyme M protein